MPAKSVNWHDYSLDSQPTLLKVRSLKVAFEKCLFGLASVKFKNDERRDV